MGKENRYDNSQKRSNSSRLHTNTNTEKQIARAGVLRKNFSIVDNFDKGPVVKIIQKQKK